MAAAPVKSCNNVYKTLDEAQKDVEERFKDQAMSDEITRALAVGEFVVDIPSIKGLNKGFRFYARNQLALDRLLKLKIKTRWIAIVGAYNAGKTFFSCLMMDRPIASDLVIRTPGITVMLSEKVEEEKKAIVAQGPPPKPEALVKELAMLGMKMRRTKSDDEKAKIQAQIDEKEKAWKEESEKAAAQAATPQEDNQHQCTFAIMDTAGDDRPCGFEELGDVCANEHVKRAVIVQTAQSMIFLTSKFDRESQEKLTALKSQMAKQRKPASRVNRIYVVHNGVDTTNKAVFNTNINEVRQCYPLTKTPDVEDYGWNADTDQATGVTFYMTEYCVHLFLVNHAKHPDGFDGVEHNMKTINRLKTMIRSTIPTPMDYPILATFTQNLMTQLPLFLMSPQWDPEYSRFYPFEEKPGVVFLSPVKLPTMTQDPQYWESRTEDTCWLDEVAGKLEDIVFEQMEAETPSTELDDPFCLAKVRIASGVAISDAVRDLEGTWFVTTNSTDVHGAKHGTIVVVLNGVNFSEKRLNPENFIVKFFQRKGELQLKVKLPAPVPPQHFKPHIEAPVLPDTWGIFTCKFPDEFILDGRGLTSFYSSEFVKVVDGALHIHLGYSTEVDNNSAF